MPRESRLRLAAGLLAIAGLAISAYIAIAEAGGGSPVCVAGSTGCATVAESDYATLAGVNVALIGAAGYIGLLAAAAVRGDPGRLAGLFLALIGFGFSLYLTYLELFVIEALCQWCVASAIVMTALLAVNLTRALGFTGAPAPRMKDRHE